MIQLYDLLCYLLTYGLEGFSDTFQRLLGFYLLFKAENIMEGQLILIREAELKLFCCVKINQIVLHQGFRNFISCQGSHGVAGNSAVPACRNIGCTGSDIYHNQIQKAMLPGNGSVNSRNWFQRQTDYL